MTDPVAARLFALDAELEDSSVALLNSLDLAIALLDRKRALEALDGTVESLELALEAALYQVDIRAMNSDTIAEERKTFVESMLEGGEEVEDDADTEEAA